MRVHRIRLPPPPPPLVNCKNRFDFEACRVSTVRSALLSCCLLLLSGCLDGGGSGGDSVALPPHPGEIGKLTLEGVDINGNGVRDDVEIFVAERAGEIGEIMEASRSTTTDVSQVRDALTQLARSMLGDIALYSTMTSTSVPGSSTPVVVDLSDARKTDILKSGQRAIQCLFSRNLDVEEEILRMRFSVIDTTARYVAYRGIDEALAGAFYEYEFLDDMRSACELLAGFSAHAQEGKPCDPNNQYKKQSIVLYTNGIKTTRHGGQADLVRIAEGWRDFHRERNARCVEYDYDFNSDSFRCERRLEFSESRCIGHMYNPSEGFLGDIAETFNVLDREQHLEALQRLAEPDDADCLRRIDTRTGTRCVLTVGERRAQLVRRLDDAAVETVEGLRQRTREYLGRGRRALLVGYSEGSLISHRVYEELRKENGGFYSEALGAILIATPLPVSSSCESDPTCLYFTNDSDVVINWLRVSRAGDPPLPGSQNPEVLPHDHPDPFDHGFRESYWQPRTSRMALNDHFEVLFGDSGAVRYPVPTFTASLMHLVSENTQSTPSALPSRAVATELMSFNPAGMLTPSFKPNTISSRPADLFSMQPEISEQAGSIVIEGGELASDRTGVWSGEVLLEEKNGTIVQTVGVGRVTIAVDLEPEMVVVPGGSFRMGDIQGGGFSDERPVHTVRIVSFAAGKYEVTWGQFAAFVDATGYDAGDRWRSPGFSQTDQHPVVYVSWDDAQAYVDWLRRKTDKRYRLLTEAEWEYAARAGTTTRYHFGNSTETSLRGNANCHEDLCADGYESTAPVGSFGANAFGLHDMHGNVWEWVEDCHHVSYGGAPTDGSAWTSNCDVGSRMRYRPVIRGGSWSYNYAPNLRAATRFWLFRNSRFSDNGFRVAQDL